MSIYLLQLSSVHKLNLLAICQTDNDELINYYLHDTSSGNDKIKN